MYKIMYALCSEQGILIGISHLLTYMDSNISDKDELMYNELQEHKKNHHIISAINGKHLFNFGTVEPR